MLTILFLAFIVGSAILGLTNWRTGIALSLVIGVLEDPIRKITPGTPPVMVLSVLPVWLTVWFAVLVRAPDGWSRPWRLYPRLGRAVHLFILCLVPGILVALSYGSEGPQLALLGGLAYGTPLLTIAVGFAFARDVREMEKILGLYAVLTAVSLAGMILEYAGLTPGWRAVGTDVFGGGWLRYPIGGGVFQLISGFYRSPDIAAWHAATLVMICLTLANLRPGVLARVWMVLVAWGGVCLLISGRRKGIAMPFVFVSFVVANYLRARRGGALLSAAFMIAMLALGFYFASGEFTIREEYVDYAQTTMTDAPGRVVASNWEALWGTFEQSGFLGAGIGSATQGAQHLGIERNWQESGPSKLLVELGVPGFLGALVLGWALVRACTSAVRSLPPGGAPTSLLQGLLGVLVANVASFAISHQIYSDFFILNLTALFLGAALSAPRWGVSQRARAASPGNLPRPLAAAAALATRSASGP